jgi:hypothetical protein
VQALAAQLPFTKNVDLPASSELGETLHRNCPIRNFRLGTGRWEATSVCIQGCLLAVSGLPLCCLHRDEKALRLPSQDYEANEMHMAMEDKAR